MEGTPERPDEAEHAPSGAPFAGPGAELPADPPAEPGAEPPTRRSRRHETGARGGAARDAGRRYTHSARSVLRPLPARIALITAVAGIAVVGATGGFAPVELVDVPEVEAGTVMDLGPYTASVESFFVTDQVATSALEGAEGAEAWLGLRVHLENTWTQSKILDRDSFTPLVGEGALTPDARPTAMLVRDGTMYLAFQPGLPEDIFVLWPLADADAVGDELVVRAEALVWAASSFDVTEIGWRYPEPVALVTVERDDELPPQVIDPPEEDE